jgi:hypothetical protein
MALLWPRSVQGVKQSTDSDSDQHGNEDCEGEGTHFLQANIGKLFSISHSNKREKVKNV